MAKKKPIEEPLTIAEYWRNFIADLTAVFLRYNGILWKVRKASEIATAATLVANTLALFGFARK